MTKPATATSADLYRLKPLESARPVVELVVKDEDWEKQSSVELIWMAQVMMLVRRFEETLLNLKDQGLINGPVHTSIGQEAVAGGLAGGVHPEDRVFGTHRAHHQFLAKALNAVRKSGYDPLRDGLDAEMTHVVQVLLAEVMGLSEGCCGGRGGSMHLFYPEVGVAGTNAIVGGGVPHATGAAWADKFCQRENITISFFGDGALYQGVVHESANLASIWQAPIVYFIENNQYAVSTRAADACSARTLSEVGVAYNMPGLRIDGMNPLAVKLALEMVRDKRDQGWLPCFIEAQTYRYFHHAGKIAGSAFGYRSKEEESGWQTRDPLDLCLRQLRRLGLVDSEKQRALEANVSHCVSKAVAHCTEVGDQGKTAVRAALWPHPDTLLNGVRDQQVIPAGECVEAEDIPCTRAIHYSDAIAQVTGRWLEKDPNVIVLGEDIANLGGGPYGATKNLSQRFPDRVRNTPITEAGFCGIACGAALNGLHPVVEIMFSSFVLVAADQLLNQIGQLSHIYGARTSVPLVVRTRVATGLGYGAQHSLDPVALFSLFPGWRIFVPTTAFDYVGLFNAAMRIKSPSLIVEHHSFYPVMGQIPDGALDFVVQPGRARVRCRGKDVTVVTYGAGVTAALAANNQVAAEGIEAEVIDLRSIDAASIDYECIGSSLRETGILLTVEEAPAVNSIGGRIISECMARFFDYFDGPPVSVNGPDVPMPVSKSLEELCVPDVSRISEMIRLSAQRRI